MAKKLVRGDFKAGRVKDPTAKLSHKHEKSVKKYIKEFMDKAVAKKAARNREKAARGEAKAARAVERDSAAGAAVDTPKDATPTCQADAKDDSDDVAMLTDDSDDDDERSPPQAVPGAEPSSDRKRKLDDATAPTEHGSPKRLRTDTPPPPPPPPPPPMDDASLAELPGAPVPGSTHPAVDASDAGAPKHELHAARQHSPVQLATPPTTTNGSCEEEPKRGDQRHAAGFPRA